MTLLTAINRAQRRLSLAVTSAVAANTEETQALLFELANTAAEDLLAREHWPLLRRTQSFTCTTSATLQASGKPSDFDRAINDTFWNTTQDRQIAGPLREEEWAFVNGENWTSQVSQYCMFRYDGLHIFPAPTVADTVTYDYIINTPVQSSGSAYKTAFTADTDTFVLGDRLLYLGVRVGYLMDKGRDYAEAMRDLEYAITQELAKQRGAPRAAYLAPADYDPLAVNVPDSGFGAPP